MDRKKIAGKRECQRLFSVAARGIVCLILAPVIAGCAAGKHGFNQDNFSSTGIVNNEIATRTGTSVGPDRRPRESQLPNALVQGLPLTIDEAIETALANNDAFHATLAQMGMAEGDYLQSSLLTNPNISTMIPVGVKQWEWTLFVPIEAFLLRPERMQMADKERERIAYQLVQTGLTLVRDVQVAYANLGLATTQFELSVEAMDIRTQIAGLTEKRLEAGDIAELEAMQSRVDALNAKANAALLQQNISIAQQQLALLMGISEHADDLHVNSIPEFKTPSQTPDDLIAQASFRRPDLQAAEWAVASAQSRCRLARKAWWRFDGIIDYNGSGAKGPEVGPGLRFDIPIFNKNEGGVMRACSEFDAANYNRDLIQDQIVQQIRTAYTQVQQATGNFEALKSEVLPTLNEAMAVASKGYEAGNTSYLLVLQTTTQYVDVKSRMLDQAAAAFRANADLDLGCGQRLASAPVAFVTHNALTKSTISK